MLIIWLPTLPITVYPEAHYVMGGEFFDFAQDDVMSVQYALLPITVHGVLVSLVRARRQHGTGSRKLRYLMEGTS